MLIKTGTGQNCTKTILHGGSFLHEIKKNKKKKLKDRLIKNKIKLPTEGKG